MRNGHAFAVPSEPRPRLQRDRRRGVHPRRSRWRSSPACHRHASCRRSSSSLVGVLLIAVAAESRSSGSAPSCCGSAASSACAARASSGSCRSSTRVSSWIDQRTITTELRRRTDADRRHGAGQRRRGAVLDGARRREGRARSAGLRAGGQLGGADGAARHHRPHDADRPAARPRADRGRAAAADRLSARTRGASPCRRSRCATS